MESEHLQLFKFLYLDVPGDPPEFCYELNPIPCLDNFQFSFFFVKVRSEINFKEKEEEEMENLILKHPWVEAIPLLSL